MNLSIQTYPKCVGNSISGPSTPCYKWLAMAGWQNRSLFQLEHYLRPIFQNQIIGISLDSVVKSAV